ncbi:hypothetical protein L3X38_012962 [Prunus dulcis]|uniref:CCHC-type domain-containing protein n=1 Tax=Prunus dulcis TaxID=3755 RepID=A0AAD4ZGJ1_PRUDU|nr:hypothetical protein L3X38_012962 [Prunus dulcis]
MANLAKLEFAALDLSGDNFLSWVLDAKIHLRANGLGQTIVDENNASPEENAKAMIFLRRHIHEALKSEYVVVDEPLVLWKALGERYDHQKTMTLPRARYEWTHLRFQDYKSVSEYNSAMHRITSLMRLCGENISEEDMLEKTLSTFHASNVLLQQQYRHSSFKKYSKLVSCLLLAEQNNELLLKNHQSRPTGSAPLPEINAASQEVNATSSREGLGPRSGPSTNGKNASRNKGNTQMSHVPRNVDSPCHRCGAKGHWVRTCRTPRHLADLYQASLKNRKVEINYIDHAPPAKDGSSEISRQLNKTHLDVSDFVTKRGNEGYESELD